MGVVAQEGIVITQQRVVDGIVGFGNEQILVLDDYLQSHRRKLTFILERKHAVPVFLLNLYSLL